MFIQWVVALWLCVALQIYSSGGCNDKTSVSEHTCVVTGQSVETVQCSYKCNTKDCYYNKDVYVASWYVSMVKDDDGVTYGVPMTVYDVFSLCDAGHGTGEGAHAELAQHMVNSSAPCYYSAECYCAIWNPSFVQLYGEWIVDFLLILLGMSVVATVVMCCCGVRNMPTKSATTQNRGATTQQSAVLPPYDPSTENASNAMFPSSVKSQK